LQTTFAYYILPMPNTALLLATTALLCIAMQSSITPENRNEHTPENTATATLLLGKTLFSEKRLSQNNTRACASCHAPELAFTDGYRRSLGIYADAQQHNSPTLLNVVLMKNMTWADSTVHTFEAQMQRAFFGSRDFSRGKTENPKNFSSTKKKL
jgi:cytochrome c peroxidase